MHLNVQTNIQYIIQKINICCCEKLHLFDRFIVWWKKNIKFECKFISWKFSFFNEIRALYDSNNCQSIRFFFAKCSFSIEVFNIRFWLIFDDEWINEQFFSFDKIKEICFLNE